METQEYELTTQEQFDFAACFKQAAINVAKTNQTKNQIEEIYFVHGYANANDGDPDKIIAVGNWNSHSNTNDTTLTRLCRKLEKVGMDTYYDDEVHVCCHCGKLVCAVASYGQVNQYAILNDADVYCFTCLVSNKDLFSQYLETREGYMNGIAHLITLNVDLEVYGYKNVLHDLQRGMHYGMDADPAVISDSLQEMSITRFLFKLDEKNQFYIAFSLWIHDSDFSKYDPTKMNVNGASIAHAMENNLRKASAALNKMPDGQGVKYAKITPEGHEEKIISRDDFINGVR